MATLNDKPNKQHDAVTRERPNQHDAARPSFDVRALVGDGREAVITHRGESYRLRITANDKLILTK